MEYLPWREALGNWRGRRRTQTRSLSSYTWILCVHTFYSSAFFPLPHLKSWDCHISQDMWYRKQLAARSSLPRFSNPLALGIEIQATWDWALWWHTMIQRAPVGAENGHFASTVGADKTYLNSQGVLSLFICLRVLYLFIKLHWSHSGSHHNIHK